MPENPQTEIRDLIRLGDLARAGELVEAEMPLTGDSGSCQEDWQLRLARADLIRLRGDTGQALTYLTERELAWPPGLADPVSLAGIRKTRGYCLGLLGRYPKSHELLKEAEQIADDSALLELKCEIHQCRAMVFYLQKDYVSSDYFFRLILAASDQLGGWYFRANALWGIGKNLMIQRHFQEALPWLDESFALVEAAQARLLMAAVWSELAVCHLGLGDDQKSLDLLEKSMAIQVEAGVTQNYQVALANIGNVYLHRGDHLRAIDYYRRALILAREINDSVSIQKWSYNIRLAYAQIRDSVDRLDSMPA